MAELQTVGSGGAAAMTAPAHAPAEDKPNQSGGNSGFPFLETFKNMEPQKRLMLLIGLPLMLGLVVAALMWSSKAEYRPLFTGVNQADGGAIINSLKQMGVPYEYSEGGDAILVPADKVYETRLQLASQGLPKGSVVGFELFENQKMGVTQFQEQVNFQRGLEGELIRSIQSIEAVKSARVHLALPKHSVFLREQQRPTASVVVTLYRGMYLSRPQLDGVVNLVASSVPQLSPQEVSVVDQTGTLLTTNTRPNDPASLTADQMAKVQRMEEVYTNRVMDLLRPIVGEDNVRATVTAKVNFQQVERSAESYRPNTDNGASIRSQQSMENSEGLTQNPGGVPGMISNAPGDVEARIGGNPNDQGGKNGADKSESQQSRESLTNYELDREFVLTKSNQVDVAMLNAAVLLNYKTVTNNRGETRQVAFTEQELRDIRAMISDALGIDPSRGDTLSVLNQNFVESPVADPYAPPPLSWMEMARQSVLPLAIAAIALGLIFGVFRPMLNRRSDNQEVLDALGKHNDPLMNPEHHEHQEAVRLKRSNHQPTMLLEERDGEQINEVKRVVKQNPEMAASIVKSWIGD
ncbi:MAG: flagellar basal-body MS-ring/collar protein FliF [Limnobacter sp.]|nr:flagellar basal-body MS-ring/collar protein FliF [Limnobacter sp.]